MSWGPEVTPNYLNFLPKSALNAENMLIKYSADKISRFVDKGEHKSVLVFVDSRQMNYINLASAVSKRFYAGDYSDYDTDADEDFNKENKEQFSET